MDRMKYIAGFRSPLARSYKCIFPRCTRQLLWIRPTVAGAGMVNQDASP